jgi:hypothetical protein
VNISQLKLRSEKFDDNDDDDNNNNNNNNNNNVRLETYAKQAVWNLQIIPGLKK